MHLSNSSKTCIPHSIRDENNRTRLVIPTNTCYKWLYCVIFTSINSSHKDKIHVWRELTGTYLHCIIFRAGSRLAPSQWEASLQSNVVSHWLGANLESDLILFVYVRHSLSGDICRGFVLIHRGRVTYICVIAPNHHWFRKWLVACSAPSHYRNTCCIIVNWTLGDEFRRNFIQNWKVAIKKMKWKISSA